MTTARDIMHVGAECVGEGDSLLKASQMMRDLDVGSLPICGEDNKLKGIITDRDIVLRCCAEGHDPAKMTAGELAQGQIHCVEAAMNLSTVLATMTKYQIRRLPVLDGRQLVGMISESDLARALPEDQLADFVEKIYASR